MITKSSLQVAYAVTLGAVAFAIAFVVGTTLNLALGPAMGGLANAVVTAMIIAIGCKGAEAFPFAVVVWIGFSIPAIFTTTMGPPGPHKLVIGIITGLAMELGFLALGRRGWVYFVVGGIMSVVMTTLILAAMLVLSLGGNSANALLARLWFLLPIYFILGGVGLYLGHLVFERRIGKLSFVARLRSQGLSSGMNPADPR